MDVKVSKPDYRQEGSVLKLYNSVGIRIAEIQKYSTVTQLMKNKKLTTRLAKCWALHSIYSVAWDDTPYTSLKAAQEAAYQVLIKSEAAIQVTKDAKSVKRAASIRKRAATRAAHVDPNAIKTPSDKKVQTPRTSKRADYRDSLGRLWRWNAERVKYDYVRKNDDPERKGK